jgi:hypothetical protein
MTPGAAHQVILKPLGQGSPLLLLTVVETGDTRIFLKIVH